MKTKIFHSSFIVLALILNIYLSGCGGSLKEPPPKPKFKAPKDHCDTVISNVTHNLNAVIYINPHKGIAVGDSGTIILTNNGGYKWKPATKQITSKHLYGLGIADTNIIVTVGESGTILRSTDAGITWTAILSGNAGFTGSLRTVMFYTNDSGYAAGDNGGIFLTTDAGANWLNITVDTSNSYYSLSYNSGGNAFFVGNKGVIKKDKGGKKDTTIKEGNLKSIHFALGTSHFSHSDTGFIVGDKGTILKTTDGGDNWINDPSGTGENLLSVFLTSSHWGYAVGENGTVLRYDGKKWKLLSKATGKKLLAVDPDFWQVTSTCVGEDGIILNYYPDSVTNGSSITPRDSNCVSWTFELNYTTLVDNDASGSSITYEKLSISSSIPLQDRPVSGWAFHDRFHKVSDILIVGQIPPPFGVNMESIPPGEQVIVTCCLKDNYGNPRLLSSFKCTPR